MNLGTVLVKGPLKPIKQFDKSRNRAPLPGVDWPPREDSGADSGSQFGHPTTVRVQASLWRRQGHSNPALVRPPARR